MTDSTAQKQQKQASKGDSLFGMALAQTFTAMVLGPVADIVWEAAEISSAIYEDRMEARKKSSNAQGEKLASITDFFNNLDKKTIAEREQAMFRPSYAPAFAF
jgi:hypothetical protein